MTTLLIVLMAVAALAVLVYLARGREQAPAGVEELTARTRPVDLEAFRNLVDPEEERFLREVLSPAEFRQVQRQRLAASIEYVRRTSHNAAVLLRLGEAARSSEDPEIARAGQELANSAVRLRLYAVLAESKLQLHRVFPQAGPLPAGFVGDYRRLTDSAGLLCRLQQPAEAARVVQSL